MLDNVLDFPPTNTQIPQPLLCSQLPWALALSSNQDRSALALRSLQSGGDSGLQLPAAPNSTLTPYCTFSAVALHHQLTARNSPLQLSPALPFQGAYLAHHPPAGTSHMLPGNAGVLQGCILGPLSSLCTHSRDVICGLEVLAPSMTL